MRHVDFAAQFLCKVEEILIRCFCSKTTEDALDVESRVALRDFMTETNADMEESSEEEMHKIESLYSTDKIQFVMEVVEISLHAKQMLQVRLLLNTVFSVICSAYNIRIKLWTITISPSKL